MKLPSAFIKDTSLVNIVIETPRGCGSKYTWDPEIGLFKLTKILPEGLVFPQHFGFIPDTKGEDGDPLDALVLMDAESYPGLLIECKILGVIEAEQTEKTGETIRNDRIITAAVKSKRHSNINSLPDLDNFLMDELTKFFITYNEMNNKKFTPLAQGDAQKAIQLIKEQMH